LLFDEFLIDALIKQKSQDWNLDSLIRALKPYAKSAGYKKYLDASKVISQRIAAGEYEIKCY
jgi:hypothetical protein